MTAINKKEEEEAITVLALITMFAFSSVHCNYAPITSERQMYEDKAPPDWNTCKYVPILSGYHRRVLLSPWSDVVFH